MHKTNPKVSLSFGDLESKIEKLERHLRGTNNGDMPELPKSIHDQIEQFLNQTSSAPETGTSGGKDKFLAQQKPQSKLFSNQNQQARSNQEKVVGNTTSVNTMQAAANVLATKQAKDYITRKRLADIR